MSATKESENITTLASRATVEDDAAMRDQEITTAAAILSVTGPCRAVGDVYLTCVATAGMGQCRHLRATFDECSKGTTEGSRDYLSSLGRQFCPDDDDKDLCAAHMVNRQLMTQAYGPPPEGQ